MIDGKTVLITGAAGGIGTAIVNAFAQYNVKIGMIDLNETAGLALTNRLSEKNIQNKFVATNLDSYANCKAAYEQIVNDLGPIDVLINNVGISPKHKGKPANIWELDPTEWEQVVNLNLNSAFYLTHLVSLHMTQQKFGRIISMSSVAGKSYCHFVASHYSATKAAIIGATRHWAAELGPFNVTVNALAPGRINTPLIQSVSQDINAEVIANTPLQRLGNPEEVADACIFLASDKANFITGQVIDVAGGWLMT